jgi:hypothetical protein
MVIKCLFRIMFSKSNHTRIIAPIALHLKEGGEDEYFNKTV